MPPRRKRVTPHDIADIRDALDLAHDIATDHREPGKITFDKPAAPLTALLRR
jgi:hypothetical protein